MKVLLVLAFVASVAVAQEPRGKLLLREVYDLDGKKVAIEEYSYFSPKGALVDAYAKQPLPAIPVPVRTAPVEYRQFNFGGQAYWYKGSDATGWDLCRECNPQLSQGVSAATGAMTLSPVPATPVFTYGSYPVVVGKVGGGRVLVESPTYGYYPRSPAYEYGPRRTGFSAGFSVGASTGGG